MNIGDKIKIVFNGKEIDVTVVQEGVVQKSPSIFYILDCVTGEWLYCFPQRLAKLQANPKVDLASYKGRSTKKAEKEVEKREKVELKARKAVEVATAAPAAPAPVEAEAEAVPA